MYLLVLEVILFGILVFMVLPFIMVSPVTIPDPREAEVIF